MHAERETCHDCEQFDSIDRRAFLRTVGGAAVASGAVPLLSPVHVHAAPGKDSVAETAVAKFHQTLTDAQKKTICMPFDDALREEVGANWHITDPKIGSDFYTTEQRGLIDDILRGITSEDGYGRLQKQMRDDARGVDNYSVAVFGEPGTGKFQWELTGRHLTLRADGDSVDNVAFGGPLVYGHGVGDVRRNLFHYQTKKVNEVFTALDSPQADKALVAKAPAEEAVSLQGKSGSFPGIAVSELTSDQHDLVEQTIKTLLAPYREADVNEAMAVLKAGGGFESLNMAFYREGDLRKDKVWDIWRIEGPSFVWHFRGAPHVHAYINIGVKKSDA